VETKLYKLYITRMGRTNISNDSIFAQKCSIDSWTILHSILYDLTDLTRDKAACLVYKITTVMDNAKTTL
jgi:hypothetical protein